MAISPARSAPDGVSQEKNSVGSSISEDRARNQTATPAV